MRESNFLRVNEIFRSFQGEGANAGRPAVFLRFSGCNKSCDFCDTKHQPFVLLTPEQVIKEIRKAWERVDFVVLTGGEPTIQDYGSVFDGLKSYEVEVAIETNGTNVLTRQFDWVTVSPKDFDIAEKWGHELKVVYTGKEDLDRYRQTFPGFDLYYAQPCSNLNVRETIEAIEKAEGWRLSLQWQKLINIR